MPGLSIDFSSKATYCPNTSSPSVLLGTFCSAFSMHDIARSRTKSSCNSRFFRLLIFESLLALVGRLVYRTDVASPISYSSFPHSSDGSSVISSLSGTYGAMIYTYIVRHFLPCPQVPSSSPEWREIAEQFEQKWNFPNCIGSMDGKHIMIRPPPNSGSYYFNYKHSFSIVLLAVVDADYKFTYVDIGCNGRISDGGVFRNCALSGALEENTLNIPHPTSLPGKTHPIPYMIVADDAFPMKEYLLKPYSQIGLTRARRIFNYRLSRARRIVENSFGILANRFRVFMQPIALAPEKVEAIVMACCCLHNFL